MFLIHIVEIFYNDILFYITFTLLKLKKNYTYISYKEISRKTKYNSRYNPRKHNIIYFEISERN